MSTVDTDQQALRKEMREAAQAMDAMFARRLAEQAASAAAVAGPGAAGPRREKPRSSLARSR